MTTSIDFLHGLGLGDTASVVVDTDGTLVLEGPSVGVPISLEFSSPGASLVANGTVELRNGADIDDNFPFLFPRPIGIRVGESGVLRSSTLGSSRVNAVVELAGRVDAAAGSLRLIGPVTTAARSATALLTASGGSLAVRSLAAGTGSRATIDGAGVTLGAPPRNVSHGGGAGDVVLRSGLLRISQWAPSGSGSLHVLSGAAVEVTAPHRGWGLLLGAGYRVINDGTITFHQVRDRTNPPFLALWSGSFNPTQVSSELVNNGKLVFQDGADAHITAGTITNNAGATITKGGDGATLTTTKIESAVDNHGTLRSESGLLKVTGAFPAITGTTLTRGTYEAVTSGMLQMPSDVTDNEATILLDGPGALFEDAEATHGLRDLTDNGGTLTVRNGARVRLGSVAQRGRLEVATGATVRATNLTQTAGTTSLTDSDTTLQTAGAATLTGGVLSGVGAIRTGLAGLTVKNTGRVEPGLAGVGALSLAGRLTLAAGGTLAVDVDGTGAGDADRMDVTGPVRLAGALAVDTGYVPVTGDSVELLSATGPLSGAFGQISGDVLAGGLAWQPSYDATSASLRASGPPA